MLSVAGLGVQLTGGTSLVRDVSFDLAAGDRVGLIGESGSGKSLTALALMGLLADGLAASGDVELAGTPGNLLTLPERARARLRGSQLGMVFQEPLSALNPVMRVGDQVAEALRVHDTVRGRSAAARRAVELLDQVRLPDPERSARAYPHQLSGGQRQRVMIAMALANDPAVLICDEPTSALDVTVQAQILELVTAATAERDTGLLFITHDLAVVATVCTRVLVMRDGEVVESGPVGDVFRDPRHPYTRALVSAVDLSAAAPAQASAEAGRPQIRLSGVTRTYKRRRASLFDAAPEIHALRGIDLDIPAGGRFGIVGESGSGKSTLVRLIAALDRPTAGSIQLDGREVAGLPERKVRFVRENLQMVFQDPTGSLDPRLKVREIVAEPLIALKHENIVPTVNELLSAVGLPADAADRYPHQFSGGQRQRISIARALAPRPKVLLADEPVSALDAPIRAQILDLLLRLADEYELTLVLVSHDLAVIRHVCSHVAVLHEGGVVEFGPAREVYDNPRHPYTRRLLTAVPTLDKALAGVTAAELILEANDGGG
ncbi:ABC transporter ATP-binding protein [Flindersiella endophytica]